MARHPSSSSHTLIGGFAGAGITHAIGMGASNPFAAVNSHIIFIIGIFIFLSPIIGMIVAFLFSLWFISSFKKTWKVHFFSVVVIIGVLVGLYFLLETDPAQLKSHYDSYILKVIFYSHNFKFILLALIIIVMAIFSMFLSSLNAYWSNVWFKRLQLVSSAMLSLGHGGNDAQKVMGIIMVALVVYDPTSYHLGHMVFWVPLACYTAMALGTMSGGWKIVKTMGIRITKVTPFEGVAAETSAAITLFVTESMNIPVSTTHTLTGSLMGVGATKRLSAVRWGVTINLLWAWILTIPVSAIVAAIVYCIMKLINPGIL